MSTPPPNRRLVNWWIVAREHDYQVIRNENGRWHLIGAGSTRAEAHGIADGDRIRVLADPLAIETVPIEYRY